MHFNGNNWKQFLRQRWIEMVQSNRRLSDQSKVILQQPLAFWDFLGFSPVNAFDWLVGLSRAFLAIIDWLVVPVRPVH